MFQETVPLRSRGRTCASKLTFLHVAWRMRRNKLGALLVGMGPALYGRVFQLAVKRGVVFRSGVTIRSLVTDGGQVTGEDVEGQGKALRISARKGVLLNTGGFALNAAMRDEWQPKPNLIAWTPANPGATGELT